MYKQRGFTLIEILIVVAIVGIIAAVAVPSYETFLKKTRRTEAKTLLVEIAGEQQRYFSENNTYADTLTTLGYPTDIVKSESGYYTASVTSADASSFSIDTARPAGSPQLSDAACGDFSINSLGRKNISGDGTVADCW